MQSIVSLVTFACIAATAYSLKCYTCDGEASFVDKGSCGDEFKGTDSQLQECNATAGQVWCRKQKTGANHVYINIERRCADQCEEQNLAYIDRVTCCQTDGCNSASSLAANIAVSMATVAMVLYVVGK